MKINKLSIFAIVLAILVSAFVCINVSAEGEAEDALTIKSINIAYKDQIELLVAVDVDYAEKDNVEVTYTIEGDTTLYYATIHPTETCVKDDVTYPVFYAAGIAPKDIGKVMTFEAHIKDSGATGTPYSASILDYLYARLYKQGYINASNDADIKRKNLYLDTIDYASSALDVLVNVKEGKNEPLFNKYVFVWSDDVNAAVAEGRAFGAFVSGTEITPVYNGAAISEWSIMTPGDTKIADVSYGTPYAVTEHIKLVAGAVDGPIITDFENGIDGEYVKVYDADGNAVTGKLPANANTLTMGYNTSGDNSYLQVRNYKGSGKNGKTEIYLSNKVQEGNCYTFETKMQIAGANAETNLAKLKFVNKNNGEALNLYLKATNNDANRVNLAIATTGSNASIAAGTTLFDYTGKSIGTSTWFTLKVEFYFLGAGTATKENTYMKLYIDEVLAYDGLASWAVGANIDHVEIEHVYSTTATHNTCYDDMYFTRTDKAYVADN